MVKCIKTLLASSVLLAGFSSTSLADENADIAKIIIGQAQTNTLGWEFVASVTTEIGPRLGADGGKY